MVIYISRSGDTCGKKIRVWRSLVSRLNGVQEALSSNLSTRTKIKGHLQSRCPFILGFAAQRAALPFGLSMLGTAEPPLCQGFHLR